MITDDKSRSHYGEMKNSIIIVVVVGITLLLAILLSLSDTLQSQPIDPQRPTFGPLVIANEDNRPTRSLPTATPPTQSGSENKIGSTIASTSSPFPTPAIQTTQLPFADGCEETPPGWIPYRVVAGETLEQLAVGHEITPDEIIKANCLQNNTLKTGMIVLVPPDTPSLPNCGPPLSWTRYMVRPGETLGLLALSHGTTVLAIMQANCLENTTIFYGRYLYLPPLVATAPIGTPPPLLSETPLATSTPLPSATNTPQPSATPKATPAQNPSPTPPMPATATQPPLPTTTPILPPTQANTPLPTSTATTLPPPTPTPTTQAPPPTPTNTPLPGETPPS